MKLTEDQILGIDFLIDQHGAENLSCVQARRNKVSISLDVHCWLPESDRCKIRAMFRVPLSTPDPDLRALEQAIESHILSRIGI